MKIPALGALVAFAFLTAACSESESGDLVDRDTAQGEVTGEAAASIESCDPAETTLDVVYPDGGTAAGEAARDSILDRYPELNVRAVSSPTASFDELTQQIVADIAGGKDVDVANIGLGQLTFFVDTYSPIPIDASVLRDTYKTQFLNVGSVDGQLYMVPAQISVPTLYYNMELMEQGGLDPSDPPATFSELIEGSRALAEVTKADPIYVWAYNWIVQAAVQSAGGQYVAEDGTPGFDSSEGMQALEIWTQLAEEGLTTYIPLAEEIAAFGTGQTAFYVSTSALASQINDQIGDSFEWSMVPMPVPDGGSASFPAGGSGWVSLADEECEAAFANAYIGEILDPETVVAGLKGYSYVPVDTEAQEILLADPSTDPKLALAYEYDVPLTPWGGWPGAGTVEANTRVTEMAVSLAQGEPLEPTVAEAVEAISRAVQ